MPIFQRYWQTRFRRWPTARPQLHGYSVIVPVPGDLPVFLDLSLAVCRLQHAPNRMGTLVVPDIATPEVTAIVQRQQRSWPGLLELVDLPLPERWTLPRLGDPGRNHAVQINAAIGKVRSTHAVLHDADLFLLEPDVHERQWSLAVSDGLDVLGVDPAWDPWYASHGVELAATWEATVRTDWMRSFPPWRHIAHRDRLFDELHVFDTTLWAQSHTPSERISVRPPAGIIHFNYVISAYRKFRQAGPGFHDDRFRLLLIRILIDLFDSTGAYYGLPSVTELAEGLDNEGAPVWYSAQDVAGYRAFRPRLAQILSVYPPRGRQTPDSALQVFDDFYSQLGTRAALTTPPEG